MRMRPQQISLRDIWRGLIFPLLVVMLAGCMASEKALETKGLVNKQALHKKLEVQWTADEQPSTVYYHLFVRSFYDTNGDGIGDLPGVTAKLDYLQELGAEGIWLMPITASPSYHGYDVTDYYAINPEYGTMEDLHELLAEAHKREMKVIIDLVVNHTSSQHPWFKEALADKNSPYRNWYTFRQSEEDVPMDSAAGSGTPWHQAGDSKYLGIFWDGMPDLNLQQPQVRVEMLAIGKFWLNQGVDGFRLDAVKHVFGDFSSTQHHPDIIAQNLDWWRAFAKGLKEENEHVYLVGEIWDSAAVIAPYLGEALQSGFNFELGTRILTAAREERAPRLAFTLKRVHAAYERASDGAFIDAIFLTNHDQNRVMSELDEHEQKAKLAASILLTLPGNPFIYYGEEIGMRGKKPDAYIREPMLWTRENVEDGGQTRWMAARYNTDGEQSVEALQNNPASLWQHYHMLLQWRKAETALQNGAIDEYELEHAKVEAYIRMDNESRVLVLHNMSAQQQTVKLAASPVYGIFDSLLFSSADESDQVNLDDGVLSLPAYTTVILK